MSNPEDLMSGLKSRLVEELDKIKRAEDAARASGDSQGADAYAALLQTIGNQLEELARLLGDAAKREYQFTVRRDGDGLIQTIIAKPVT